MATYDASSPAFHVMHEKLMVVDDRIAFVESLNWATRNLKETRDYAVVTTRRHDVAEIVECFEADWHRQPFVPRDRSQLVWRPGLGRARICRFIDRTASCVARRRKISVARRTRDDGDAHIQQVGISRWLAARVRPAGIARELGLIRSGGQVNYVV